MDLLERYLQAVRKHLPWDRQDDILAELRANLEAQLEDRESELGRPLTAPEMEAWLKEIGPPIKVAGRYQPQQYVIGPGLYPTYWYVLRLALTWSFAVYAIVTAVGVALQWRGGWPVYWSLVRLPGVLLTTAAWVTLVFAVLETMVTRWPEQFPALNVAGMDWNPGSLPPVEEIGGPGEKRPSYAKALAGTIFHLLFIVWLLLLPKHPFLLLGPEAYYLDSLPFQLSGSLWPFYWCVVGINVLQVAWHCAELLSGTWQRSRSAERLVMKVLGLIPPIVFLHVKDQAYVTLRHPLFDQGHYGVTLRLINQSQYRVAQVILTIVLLQICWEVGQVVAGAYRKRVAAMG
jgi:hypothetical protein